MSKNRIIRGNEIDLLNLIFRLWHHKILIIIFSLIFEFLGYAYKASLPVKPSKFRTEIKIDQNKLFEYGDFNFVDPDIIESVFIRFNIKIHSLDNIINFVNQNNQINEFKKYLKSNNLSEENYFKGKFRSKKTGRNNPIEGQYIFDFHESLKGDKFANEYIIYTYKLVNNEIKNIIKKNIKSEINHYEFNLKIAKKLDLKFPQYENNLPNQYYLFDRSLSLYLHGIEVLESRINYFNSILKNIDLKKIDGNPILDKALKPYLVYKKNNLNIYPLTGFVFGLFLSLVIIFFKYTIYFRKTKKVKLK